MKRFRKSAWMALALASVIGAATADEHLQSGRQVFERRCRTCHGDTAARANLPIGPSLTGIIGTQAGTQDNGVLSRAVIDSRIVWNRESLRRFLANPQPAIPGTLMPVSVVDPAELETLLDYLEYLR
jgi:cytochrome c